VWRSSSDSCSGVAWSCSGYSSSSSCIGQDGCDWDDGCTGIPDACSELSVSICDLQPGCYVTELP
jgi:hypothetical protein